MAAPPVTIYANGTRDRILRVLRAVEEQLPQGSRVWVDPGLVEAPGEDADIGPWQGHASIEVDGAERRADAIAQVDAAVAAADNEEPPVITGGDIFQQPLS